MHPLLHSAFRVLTNDGPAQLAREAAYLGVETALRQKAALTGTGQRGTPVYDRDWDVLVILDACRVDLLEEVAASGDHPYLDDIRTFRSLGSSSEEWMRANFTDEFADEMADTAFVTANVYSESALDENAFALVDEVWRYGWDDELGTTPPRPVTDRAIATMRDHDPERLIVHYMQPHAPFISDRVDQDCLTKDEAVSNWGGREGPKPIWKRMRDGAVSYEDVWAAYRDTLEAVLDDVGLLLNSIDAETVAISADHGNAIGEAMMYGHPAGIPLDCLREVPWVETTATDTEEYEPSTEARSDDLATADVTERLRSLGYHE